MTEKTLAINSFKTDIREMADEEILAYAKSLYLEDNKNFKVDIKPADLLEPIALLEYLANKGIAEAQNCLGEIYYFGVGRGNKIDDVEASKWFNKAAENGHRIAQSYLNQIKARQLAI